jgi:Mn2+/Fe2+ NRAMP family transporter
LIRKRFGLGWALVAVLAVLLYFMLRLSDDRRLIGDLTNGRGWRIVAWATALVVTLLALTMLVNLGAEALGVNLFARLGA